MKKSYLLLGVVGVILICALILGFKLGFKNLENNKPQNLVGNDRDEHGCIASAGYSWCELKQKCLRPWEENCEIATSTSESPANDLQATFSDEVVITSPKQNELISSPVKIEGTATGNWFFEATLPIKLYDNDNNLIVAHYGTAQDDWMTEKPVRFTSELTYSTMATSGYLVISKDNPSGLPENDASVKVPVLFK